MTTSVDATWIAGLILALARTSAWVLSAPVLSTRGLPSVGRLAVALSLSVFLAPTVAAGVTVPAEPVAFGALVVTQVLIGLLLGWVTGLVLAAFEVAGAAIDLTSGLAIASLIDPMTGNQAAVMSRYVNVVFVGLLFSSGGHRPLIAGFVRSFGAVPAGIPDLDGGVASLVARAAGGLVLAAVEIAAPVLGALLLTEVALGLAARFAPHANVFMVGLPLKMLVTLAATGAMLVWLPSHLERLVSQAVDLGALLG